MSNKDLEARMSPDLLAVLSECKLGNLAIINGELIEPGEDEAAFVLLLPKGIYSRLISHAAEHDLNPEEIVTDLIESKLDFEDDDEELAKFASDINYDIGAQEDEPEEDSWYGKSDPPPAIDDNDSEVPSNIIGWGAGTVSDYKNRSVANRETILKVSNNSVLDSLEQVVDKIRESCDGEFSLLVDYSSDGSLMYEFKYPEDDYQTSEIIEGDTLNDMTSQLAAKLDRWHDVWFSPKIEGNTEISASIQARVIEFDKKTGKYVVSIGSGLTVHVSPEDISKL